MAVSEINRSTALTLSEVQKASGDETNQEKKRPASQPEPTHGSMAILSLQSQDRYIRGSIERLMSAIGITATQSPTYEFQKGPDNKLYAVDGKLKLNVFGMQVPGDPEKTLANLRNLRRATQVSGNSSITDPSAMFTVDTLEKTMRQRIQISQAQSEAESQRKQQPYDPAGKQIAAGQSGKILGSMFDSTL